MPGSGDRFLGCRRIRRAHKCYFWLTPGKQSKRAKTGKSFPTIETLALAHIPRGYACGNDIAARKRQDETEERHVDNMTWSRRTYRTGVFMYMSTLVFVSMINAHSSYSNGRPRRFHGRSRIRIRRCPRLFSAVIIPCSIASLSLQVTGTSIRV